MFRKGFGPGGSQGYFLLKADYFLCSVTTCATIRHLLYVEQVILADFTERSSEQRNEAQNVCEETCVCV